MLWTVAAVVLAYAVAEVAVRLLVGAPRAEPLPALQVRAHPTRGWAMVPDSWHFTYGHRVRVNSLGLRGLEPGPKPRVAVVGDTFVYGLGLADDETFPARLDRLLERRSVVNAGVRAYSTNQEVALLEELAGTLDAETTVLCWQWDDLRETDIAAAFRRIEGRGDVAFDTRSRIEGWTWWKWQARELLRRSAVLMALNDARKDPAARVPRDADWERVTAMLSHARRAARSRRFVLFVVPHPLGIHDPGFPSRALERELLARWPGESVYPLEHLRAAFDAPPVIPYDGHYDAAAMEVMARAAAAALD